MSHDPKPGPPPAPRNRNFWQRWIADPIVRQLTQGVSPRKVALSLAVGSALALFPILGTTTALCLVAGIVLGLNQPIIQGVNALCTPVYFPLILAFVRMGDVLAGGSHSSLNIPAMIALFSRSPREFLHQFGDTALHAILGWAAIAPFWVALVYVAVLPALKASARKLAHRAKAA